jgi:hypothetical protein
MRPKLVVIDAEDATPLHLLKPPSLQNDASMRKNGVECHHCLIRARRSLGGDACWESSTEEERARFPTTLRHE